MSATANLTPNPYFDPNPTWLFVILKMWFLVGVITTFFAFYVVGFKSPAYNQAIFRYALLYYISVGALFHLHLTILTPPLIYLPYTAVGFWGIWSALGVDVDIQVSLVISLLIMAVSVIIPFLYYRMDCLLPQYHPLNKIGLRYSVYLITYGLSHIFPMPLLVCACRYTDQSVVKKYYEDTYHVYLEGFWKKEVVVVLVYGNPWATAFVVLLVIVLCLMTTISFGCIIVIYRTIKVDRSMISEQMKRDRTRMLVSLIILMVIVTSVAVIFFPIILYSIFTVSPRCDIFNIMVACAGVIYPSFVTVYIASYKPYRLAFIEFFKKMGAYVGIRNSTIVAPAAPNGHNKY